MFRLSAWRKVQLFNVRQSYMADRRRLANRKAALIYFVITQWHITQMLTIKQQILILKLQFIYGVNGDGSKTAKIIKKVILLSITLIFRRCDGSNDADSCKDVPFGVTRWSDAGGVTRWSDTGVTRGVTRGVTPGVMQGVTLGVTRWGDAREWREEWREEWRGSDAGEWHVLLKLAKNVLLQSFLSTSIYRIGLHKLSI